MARAALVAGARRRRGGDVPGGDGAARGAGYEQYEISNVARPGRVSRHNLKYWTDGEWLGFGCGAHSTVDGVRWKNVSATEDYIVAIDRQRPARRPTGGSCRPRSGSATRCSPGCGWRRAWTRRRFAARYGVDVWERYGAELEPFVDAGLLVAGRRPAAADPPRDASCPRGDGGFRVAGEYGKVTSLSRRRRPRWFEMTG